MNGLKKLIKNNVAPIIIAKALSVESAFFVVKFMTKGEVQMKWQYRSMLFIPGVKDTWLAKLNENVADAIIMDLEDSVPQERKVQARDFVAEALSMPTKKSLWVRINKTTQGYALEDIEAIVCEALTGIVVPKVASVADVIGLSAQLAQVEQARGLAVGSIRLLPMLETAQALWFAYDIASIPRVAGIAGISSKNGDAERSLGTRWTEEGLETLYLKSRTVMAARATGKMPIGGLWQNVHDLDGLTKAASFNRQLGYDGELILHPSNAPIVNQAYAPTLTDIAYYEGMIAAFEQGKQQGVTAMLYEGEHIDYAHVETAKEIVAYAKKMLKGDAI